MDKDTAYWDLFWKTGMPEAWLMGRDTEYVPPSGTVRGAGQGLDSPLTTAAAAPVSVIPGNPGNFY